ncbi:MAG: sodium-dependent transporter [Endomicrobium sp.]|jgi:NSS family neurotransmitter:Na+ symporter|uniref:sodium-dependent transporter n=1 Tax=Candidatus Endomicrobiellum cubanum TaxID=3242325 RepID=UPI0028236DA7|nr:sodium-dependent transporter [Endomicrobium sp.]
MGSAKDSFSSKWGLIFAAASTAIGLGNMWLFPYRVGERGGAAFVIPYVVCAIALGLIALIGEVSVGRFTGGGPATAFKKILQLRTKNTVPGEAFGWVCVLVAFLQAVGYTLVFSWVIRFTLGSLTGSAFKAVSSNQYYITISSNEHVLFWMIVTLLTAVVTLIGGIRNGIEKSCAIMLPAIFILIIILGIRVAFLPNAIAGYKYLFSPDWKYMFDVKTWMIALGQVFYSLSLRGSTMVTYGSYTKKESDIISSAKYIVFADTFVSILATFMIIPAVFAFGKDLNSGPALLFITLPDIFKAIPFGQFFMFTFFLAIFFAALTSFIGQLEVVVQALHDKFKVPRLLAIFFVSAATVLLCKVLVVGNIRKVIDLLSLHLIPLCALGSAIFFFWLVPKHLILQEVQTGRSKPVGKWIVSMGRYALCGMVLFIYVLTILKI